MIKFKKPIPTTQEKWEKEISDAYLDAKETILFAPLTGQKMTEKDLYHLAPGKLSHFLGD
jgi:hypothetical protein